MVESIWQIVKGDSVKEKGDSINESAAIIRRQQNQLN